jgi:hypothetical protein
MIAQPGSVPLMLNDRGASPRLSASRFSFHWEHRRLFPLPVDQRFLYIFDHNHQQATASKRERIAKDQTSTGFVLAATVVFPVLRAAESGPQQGGLSKTFVFF